MPYPPPAICQWRRWSEVAFSRRGYHASGTVMVRPSTSRTLSSSSEHSTDETRSSVILAEMAIPRLQQFFSMLFHETVQFAQFPGTESDVSRQRNRIEPKLSRKRLTVNVDVGWFVRLVAIKVEPVRPRPENRRHCFDCSRSQKKTFRSRGRSWWIHQTPGRVPLT